MGWRFKKHESMRKAVRRLGSKRMDQALRKLGTGDRLVGVHEARKDIKQTRALLRLVRLHLASSDYRGCMGVLRKAAGYLSEARDARVKIAALSKLAGDFRRELKPRPFRGIGRLLADECRQEEARLEGTGAARSVARLFRKARAGFGSLCIKGSGWSVIAPGLERAYREGRRGYQRACKEGSVEHFHEWRKRVKDLYYQSGLLRPVWPEQLCAMRTELKSLSSLLGEDHDLFLLAGSAAARFREQAREEAEALKTLVAGRQKELRAEALALGGRFYEEKPAVFVQRLGHYWKRWRHAKKHVRTPN